MPVIIRRKTSNPITIPEPLVEVNTIKVYEPQNNPTSIIEDTQITVIDSYTEVAPIPSIEYKDTSSNHQGSQVYPTAPKVTLSSKLPRIYTEFKTAEVIPSTSDEVHILEIPGEPKQVSNTKTRFRDTFRPRHGKSRLPPSNIPRDVVQKQTEPIQNKVPQEVKNYPPKVQHTYKAPPSYGDDLESMDHIKCLDCKDTKKVLVYETCDNCLGKGCKYCYNTGDIKTYIPCQSCNSKTFRFNR